MLHSWALPPPDSVKRLPSLVVSDCVSAESLFACVLDWSDVAGESSLPMTKKAAAAPMTTKAAPTASKTFLFITLPSLYKQNYTTILYIVKLWRLRQYKFK